MYEDELAACEVVNACNPPVLRLVLLQQLCCTRTKLLRYTPRNPDVGDHSTKIDTVVSPMMGDSLFDYSTVIDSSCLISDCRRLYVDM